MRRGRIVVYSSGLENRHTARCREFESHPLRRQNKTPLGTFYFVRFGEIRTRKGSGNGSFPYWKADEVAENRGFSERSPELVEGRAVRFSPPPPVRNKNVLC